MRTNVSKLCGAIIILIFLTNTSRATVLWDGDAANGTGIFKALNVEDVGSTLTVETDASYGSVWKFYKPGTSPRCEAHAAQGFQAAQDNVFYLGWRCKLTMATNTKTYAIFQWKSYPTDVVNHPIMLRTLDGNFVLEQYNPDGSGNRTKTVLWSAPVVTGSWVSFVVKIKASASNSGYVQFWYNGVQQTFTTGSNTFSCTTLTSDYCDPKWGVYNDVADNTTVTNYVSGLKIATTYTEAAPVMYTAPDAPSSLSATAVSGTQINLTWADNSDDETSFRVQRSPDNVTFSTVATVGANVTSYSDNSLSALTTYYYRVRAENAYGISSYSARASATTLGVPPAAPSSLSAAAISSSQINLTWADNSDNEDSFAIERSANGSTWSSLTSVATNVTSYSNTGLIAGTTYYYRVRAVNSAGNSSYAGIVSATTLSNTLTNVALNKTATASSTWSSSYPASLAVDGSASTRWASASGITAATLEINLGGSYSISRTTIKEYSSRVSSYKIQYWTGSAWADAYTGTTIGSSKTDNFTAVTTTKVRLNILNCSTAAPSIYEFEVYGYLKSASVASAQVTVTDLSVFPNPVSVGAQVNYSLETSGKTEIAVFDLHGKKVATLANGLTEAGNYSASLDVSMLSNGAYFLRLVSGNTSKSVKVIVNK